MRILLLAQHFAPEEVSGAVLATELASDLAARGHEVSFVTCAPNYPAGRVFPGYRNRPLSREILEGVDVIRTWSYISPRKTFWRRVFNYGTFSASALAGALVARKPDVIFSYSPPLPLGVSAYLLSRLWRVPWLLRVEDLYPDSAIVAGFLRNRAAIKVFYALERFLYTRADHISLISTGFREVLLQKGIRAGKLSVTPVWADPDAVRPLPKANAFRQAHDLNGHFVAMYAGNLGVTSRLEDVLLAARYLREHEQIRFLIVGDGVKKEGLQALARRQKLDNVLFLPFQPRALFPEMMAAMDVGFVTLNADSSWTSLPSKTFNIMASERPILSVAPPESEIARLVASSGAGINVPPGAARTLADTILALSANKMLLQDMGKNGRRELEENYAREQCVDAFERALARLVS